MQDRVPGAPGQYKASVTAEEFLKLQTGEVFTITMTRDDQPIVEGTPYSKAAVLPDEVAAIICPSIENPTPADAFHSLGLNKAALLNAGTYTESVNKLGSGGVPLNSVAWTTPDTTDLPITGTGVYGILETWASNAGIVLQRITYTSGKAYERMYYNGEWKAWNRTDNGAITRETLDAAPKINIGTYAGDLNSLTDIPLNSIAWIVAGTCTNCPTGNYAILETWGTSTRMQRLTTVSGPAAQRIYVNGSWTEWEWLNAPMTIGVEYRTTERWNTQPVYTRIVNCGTLVEGRKLTTVAALAGCKIYEAKGYAVNSTKGTSYLIPSIYETTGATTSLVMLVNTGGTSGDIQIFAGSEHAGTTAYVMLKYIKS